MASLLLRFSNLFRDERPCVAATTTNRPRFDLSEVPKYPPYHPGLPAVTPEQIVQSQRELIDRLRNAVSVSNTDFERTYLSAIWSYAAFVHLLPASESHHHRGTGGLFRHGLEAALYGAQHADRLMFVMDEPPSRRRVLEPIWRFAAVLAALNHDIGKPLSDVAVQDQSGELSWNPFAHSLHQWAELNAIDYYHIRFRPGRHQDHEMVGMLALEQVIGSNVKQYLVEAGPKLMRWMIAAIANAQGTESINPFRDLVIRADRDSVERDLRINGAMQSNMPSVGIAAERFVLDAMRRLIRNKSWRVNQKGARVWVIDGNLYVAWNAARDIVRVIAEDNTPGVPRDPDSIADMLIERELAVARESSHGLRRYWTIAPALLGGVTLKTLRLSSPDLLLDPSPGNVVGSVLSGDEEEMPATDQEQAESSVNGTQEKSNHKSDPETEGGCRDVPFTDLRTESEPDQEEQHSNKAPSPKPATEPNPTAAAKPIESPFKSNRIVSEIISTLVDEIQAGKRSRETVRQSSGLVAMAWPDAFQGFGMEPRAVLKEMTAAGLVEPDPAMPTRMVQSDAEGNKIVAMRHQEGMSLLVMIGEEGNKDQKSKPSISREGGEGKPKQKGNRTKRARKDVPVTDKGVMKSQDVPPVPEQQAWNPDDIVARFIEYYLAPNSAPPFVIMQIAGGVSLPFNLAAAYFARINETKPKVIKNALLTEEERSNSRITLTRVRNSLRIEIQSKSPER
ncbi:MAG: TraI domain-containing protein [Candidatus Thiodiazotropha lotti]|nr:TraI domain-containing protein [Candidatus Thiodiazotropha lotti]